MPADKEAGEYAAYGFGLADDHFPDFRFQGGEALAKGCGPFGHRRGGGIHAASLPFEGVLVEGFAPLSLGERLSETLTCYLTLLHRLYFLGPPLTTFQCCLARPLRIAFTRDRYGVSNYRFLSRRDKGLSPRVKRSGTRGDEKQVWFVTAQSGAEVPPPRTGRNVERDHVFHGFRFAPPVATFRRPFGTKNGGANPVPNSIELLSLSYDESWRQSRGTDSSSGEGNKKMQEAIPRISH